MNARRFVELWLGPLAILLAMAVPFTLWGERLPDPIAVHWGPGGTPDRGGARELPFIVFFGLFTAGWIVTLNAITQRRIGGTDARTAVAVLYGLGSFLAATYVLGLSKSLDVTDWRQAGELPLSELALLLPLGAIAGAVGWALGAGHDVVEGAGVEVAPLLGEGGERLVWSGTATNRKLGLVVLIPVVLGVTVALTAEGSWALALALVSVGFVAATIAVRASATVGPEGVRVRLGPFGVPGKRIAMRDIERVTVEHIEPLAFGGWGWRIVPGAQAFIVRCGPGLRISRRSGNDIVVTVDDAERGAAVLTGHLAGGHAPES